MRVLVLRPEEAGRRTALRLQARGHEVIVAPVLTLRASDTPMPEGAFDALVLTSAAALIAFDEVPALLPVFAVGDRTAEAARKAGFQHVTSAAGDREALAVLAQETLPPDSALLVAAGRDHKADLLDLLHQAGHKPMLWIAYIADAATDLPQAGIEALRDHKAEAVLHYSRRSAEIGLDLARRAGLIDAFLALPQICLSSDVAAPLEAAGATQLHIAGRPVEEALFAALDKAATA